MEEIQETSGRMKEGAGQTMVIRLLGNRKCRKDAGKGKTKITDVFPFTISME